MPTTSSVVKDLKFTVLAIARLGKGWMRRKREKNAEEHIQPGKGARHVASASYRFVRNARARDAGCLR